MALNFLNNGYFAGKVGIGTESPSRNLQVKGTANTAIAITSSTASLAQLALGDTDDDNYAQILLDNSTNKLQIQNGGGGIISNRGITLDSSENVGIGTASPISKFTVTGTDNTNQANIGHSTQSVFIKVNGTNVDYNSSGNSSGSHTFSTGNVERMCIEVGGNVGIGTTSPAAGLQVAKGGTTIPTAGSSTASAVFGNSTSDDNYGVAIGANSSGVGYISSQRTDGTATTYNLAIQPNGGNVGIGTTSPNAKLHIGPDSLVSGYTPDRSTLAISDTTNGGQLIIRGQSPRIWFDGTAGGNAELFLDGSKLNILSGRPDALGSSRLYIKADGNVGIGTTSPDSLLTVSGSSLQNSNNAGIELSNSHNSQTVLLIENTTSRKYEVAVGGSANSIGNGSFYIYDGTAGAARLVIDSSGNVGIGTTSPQQKLDVVGRVRASYDTSNYYEIGASSAGGFVVGKSGGVETVNIRTYGDSHFNGGNFGIGTSSPTAKLHVVGTGLFTGLVSGITPVAAANFVTKAYVDGSGGGTGPFLPLAGGTMTGVAGVVFPDAFKLNLGTGSDLQIYHNATDSVIENITGDLYITNKADDKDIVFRNDDGAGGYTTYFYLDGGRSDGTNFATRFPDQSIILLGSGTGWNDGAQIYHSGTNTHISNYVGHLDIRNYADDGDIIFRNDDGSGGITEYFRLDGGTEQNVVSKNMRFEDGIQAQFGAGTDLRIYHDGGNSLIKDTGTGVLYIGTNAFRLTSANLSENMISAFEDGAVNLYYNNSLKIATTTTGVTVTGNIEIDSALLSNQENTDVDTGTETVASVAIATYTAAFFDFVIKKTTNVRSGTVYACHDGTNVEFTETSTQDLGDTSDVTLSVDISGGNMRLRATTTSDDWSVKSLIRAI